jgi:hypothetical protein
MSALAARRAQFQASQNQSPNRKESATAPNPGMATADGVVAGAGTSTVRWSTADDRALEEAVGRARMGLLFVGVKA